MPTASDHRKAEAEQQTNNSFPVYFSSREHVVLKTRWQHGECDLRESVLGELKFEGKKGKRKSMDSM